MVLVIRSSPLFFKNQQRRSPPSSEKRAEKPRPGLFYLPYSRHPCWGQANHRPPVHNNMAHSTSTNTSYPTRPSLSHRARHVCSSTIAYSESIHSSLVSIVTHTYRNTPAAPPLASPLSERSGVFSSSGALQPGRDVYIVGARPISWSIIWGQIENGNRIRKRTLSTVDVAQEKSLIFASHIAQTDPAQSTLYPSL